MDFIYQFYKMIQCLPVISWLLERAFVVYYLFTNLLVYSATYSCVFLDFVGNTTMDETWIQISTSLKGGKRGVRRVP